MVPRLRQTGDVAFTENDVFGFRMVLEPHGRHLGVLLVTVSAVVFSLAGVLTKMIESDAWTSVLVWKRRSCADEKSGAMRAGWTSLLHTHTHQ